jgi:hypothetical protein
LKRQVRARKQAGPEHKIRLMWPPRLPAAVLHCACGAARHSGTGKRAGSSACWRDSKLTPGPGWEQSVAADGTICMQAGHRRATQTRPTCHRTGGRDGRAISWVSDSAHNTADRNNMSADLVCEAALAAPVDLKHRQSSQRETRCAQQAAHTQPQDPKHTHTHTHTHARSTPRQPCNPAKTLQTVTVTNSMGRP